MKTLLFSVLSISVLSVASSRNIEGPDLTKRDLSVCVGCKNGLKLASAQYCMPATSAEAKACHIKMEDKTINAALLAQLAAIVGQNIPSTATFPWPVGCKSDRFHKADCSAKTGEAESESAGTSDYTKLGVKEVCGKIQSGACVDDQIGTLKIPFFGKEFETTSWLNQVPLLSQLGAPMGCKKNQNAAEEEIYCPGLPDDSGTPQSGASLKGVKPCD